MRPGMNISLGQNMSLQQKMVLAPQIIQSIEILQLPIMALQERIDQELLENPALDTDLSRPEEEEDSETPRQEDRKTTDDEESFDTKVEELGSDWGEYFSGPKGSGGGGSSDDEDKKLAAMNNTAARGESLQDNLMLQLSMMELDEATRALCEGIIYSLDKNGYLLYSIEELVGRSAPENVVELNAETNGEMEPIDEEVDERMEEAYDALHIVQSLEPRGIACRDTRECLLLQIPYGPEQALPRRIVENHLDDLKLNRLPKIAKETGTSIEDIKESLHYIATLNPWPGNQFSEDQNHYVIPDVILEYVDGRYEISLQNGYVPRLMVSPAYEKMIKEKGQDAATMDFIRKKIQAARWLMESIEQRRATVYKIATEIVKQQRDFLDRGIAFLHPLKMQAVADIVGVHVSTVSRALSDKYIQTPRGIFPMKYFFTGGIESEDGSSVSTKSIQQALVELIDNEDKKNPMSDEEIVAKLKEKKMDISRRTVTKYRKQLSIPSSRQRREY